MADEPRVLKLLEELMDSSRTPEEACSDDPDLLAEVQRRWRKVRAMDSNLSELFPTQRRSSHSSRRHNDSRPFVVGGDATLPQVPGYEIEHLLGRGGMGMVYKAKHLKLKRHVALKMLLLGANATEQELACLIREAQAVASLRHPGIVQVYDVGELDGLPYFTMELIDGGTLATKLNAAPQPARRAAELVASLADAMESAHRGGVVHRDLKPANILVAADGSLKIVDFSLARSFGGDPATTLSNARVGTPSYMAPEQVVGSADAFYPAVDIYALGAVLYETLTGRPPFRAESSEVTLRQVVQSEPVAPSKLNPKVPRDLETICLTCLRKDPADRYATSAALAEDLRRFLNGEPIRARMTPLWERGVQLIRRKPTASALAVTGALCIGLAVFAALREWHLAVTRHAEEERWADRLAFSVGLQREGRYSEARAMLIGISDSAWEHVRLWAKRAQADLDLAEHLESIRSGRGRFLAGGGIDYQESSDRYELAFSNAGLGRLDERPEDVAERLKRSPIRYAILAALDDWAACANATPRAWVLKVATLLDPDPWRDRVRDQEKWADLVAIAQLAEDADVNQQPVTPMVALATRWRRLGGDPAAFLKRIQQRHPEDFWANFELGHVMHGRDVQAAIQYGRAAVALRPGAAAAHFNLGVNLDEVGRFDEACHHFQRTLEIDPDHAWARANLGLVLFRLGRFEEAALELGKAQRLDLHSASHSKMLRTSLINLGRTDEARADWTRWLDQHTSTANDWNGYAELCLFTGDTNAYQRACSEMSTRFGTSDDPHVCERIARACLLLPCSEQQTRMGTELIDRALAVDPARYEPWARPYFLVSKGLAEYRAGRYDRAIEILHGEAASVLRPAPKLILAMALHRAGEHDQSLHELALAINELDWRAANADSTEEQIYHILRREAESLVLPNLAAFLRHEHEPTTQDERMALVGFCTFEGRYADVARLHEAMLQADPTLADTPGSPIRYNAACFAALAASGTKEDLSQADRTAVRGLALNCLEDELTMWQSRAEAGSPLGGEPLQQALTHWRTDPDLAGLREAKEIAKLSEPQRARCAAIWRDVDALLERSRKNQ